MAQAIFVVVSIILDECCPPEFLLESLGRFLLKSALMSGLQNRMWVDFGYLEVTVKSQVAAWRFKSELSVAL